MSNVMFDIVPPAIPHVHDLEDRAIDCQNAVRPAFEVLTGQAALVGWTEDEVAAALLQLAGHHISAVMEDQKKHADVWAGSVLNMARTKQK